MSDEEYLTELNKKLQEEVKEYLENNDIEELADIVEVIYGILNSKDISIEEFETMRKNKVDKRGNKKNYYDIPGGKIEDGEVSEQTAIREMKEETGLNG